MVSRGAFWIQRNSNTSGESNDSLKRAVWFSWLRQDIWAAFRTGRPALTIHQPTKSMSDLTTEELTTRIIYITAKCVSDQLPIGQPKLTWTGPIRSDTEGTEYHRIYRSRCNASANARCVEAMSSSIIRTDTHRWLILHAEIKL